jgi:DNA-binding response OmpR family regulator
MFSGPPSDLHHAQSPSRDDPHVLTDGYRTETVKGQSPLIIDHLEIRPAEYQVLVDGRRAGLTVREFQIFYALAQRLDRVVRRQELYELVWGGPMTYRDRSVDVFIRKVRRKQTTVSPEWAYIHTHFGIGYRLSIEPARPGAAAE